MKKTLHILLVFCLSFVSAINLNAQIESDLQISAGGGSGGNDIANHIAYDTDGNLYVCGEFGGTAFFEFTPLISAGSGDIFLAKYNSAGDLLWVKRAGGTAHDRAFGITVSGTAVYITGTFNGTANFNTPSSSGSNEITSAGSIDIFIAKYNTNGDFQWAKRAGGTGSDWARGIAIDSTDVYITGDFNTSADFNTPTASGSNEIISAGGNDIFLAKYNSNGDFQWAKRAGGTGYDIANDIAVNGTDVYITGYFDATADFNTPSASGSNEITSAGGNDIFLAKYDNNGDVQWIKRAGGLGNDQAYGVTTNGTEVYLTGYFNNTANFNTPSATGSNEITSAGGSDVFLAKYDNNGDFLWTKRAGGTGFDMATEVVISDNDVYIAGSFETVANFNTPSDVGSNEIISDGSGDIFLAKYDNNGGFLWTKRAGGTDLDRANGIAINGTEVYLAGRFRETANFNSPSAAGSNEITAAGGDDIFLAKYSTNGSFQWVRRAGGGAGGHDEAYHIAIDDVGNIYTCGSFNGTAYFDNNLIISDGGRDIFISKHNNNGDLLWVKRAGGTGHDIANGIALNDNELYIVGSFRNTANFNNPSASGSNEITSEGGSDLFLAKYDTSGNVLWVKRGGGSGSDSAINLEVNDTHIYICGWFSNSANFNTPSSAGSNEIISAGDEDIFLAKYSTNGDFQWAKRAGGTATDRGFRIVDNGPEVYICGVFRETINFNTPSATGSNEITSAGNNDIFLAKYNSNGDFQWARRAGGEGSDFAFGLAVNGSEVYITGDFNGTADFNTPSSTGTNEITSAGFADIYLAKYNNNGDFQWVRRAGGTSGDLAYDMVVNGTEVYITGWFKGTANFNTPSSSGSNEITSAGNDDIFLAKFNNNGDFQWAKRAGGTQGDHAFGIAVNDTEVCIAGEFQNTANFNNPSSTGSNEITSVGGNDIFIARFSCVTPMPTGNTSQNFCDSATVADLTTTSGNNINWYDANSGGISLMSNTELNNGLNYFASQTDNGCESANRLMVTVTINNSPLNTITTSGNILTADEVGASYQWLDCDNNDSPISGATDQSYTPSSSGNYAVEITKAGCTSVSSCTYIGLLGINEQKEQNISIYPNPNTGKFTIVSEQLGRNYMITDSFGKVITEGAINQSQTEVEISNNAVGLYILTIDGYVYKIVKQ